MKELLNKLLLEKKKELEYLLSELDNIDYKRKLLKHSIESLLKIIEQEQNQKLKVDC